MTQETELQELLRHAEKAREPGSTDKVVHKGSDDTPPTVVTSIKSAGYCYIYDTVTGERSITNNNMLLAQLKKKRPDGSNVFTTVKPSVVPARGTLKCYLHEDSPDRVYYDSLGLPICKKNNLTSPFQVKRHMQKRHKMEWEAIESERLEKANERSIRLQESLILAAGGKIPLETTVRLSDVVETVGEPELYVSDKPYKSKRKKR